MDGQANPGDTLRHTAQIGNADSTHAAGSWTLNNLAEIVIATKNGGVHALSAEPLADYPRPTRSLIHASPFPKALTWNGLHGAPQNQAQAPNHSIQGTRNQAVYGELYQ